jgi:hypothetical protein
VVNKAAVVAEEGVRGLSGGWVNPECWCGNAGPGRDRIKSA